MKQPIRKVDANQPEIVETLRACGASVQSIHTVGQGCPDILVGAEGLTIVFGPKMGKADAEYLVHTVCSFMLGDRAKVYSGANMLVEIKDGEKPPSKRKLTSDEKEWHEKWEGQVTIWESASDALRAMGRSSQSES